MKRSILITGVGAVIGQGIIKSLKEAAVKYRLIAIDANPDSVGFKWVDAAYTVPRVDEPSWADVVVDVCNRENVALILPGIEQDVKGLLRDREKIASGTAALPLLNSPEALKVGLDKWELYLFSMAHGISMPATWLLQGAYIDALPSTAYPLLLKPRSGLGGKGIYRAESAEEIRFWGHRVHADAYMVQQHVGTDDEEYTVSIFGFRDGGVSEPFALRRRLNYGSTFEAETFDDDTLGGIVTELAKKLRIVGPTNMQFRRSGGEYYLLEVNPRFSSSTSMKSAFGFNEPVMAVESFLEGKPHPVLELKKGRCSRYLADLVTLA